MRKKISKGGLVRKVSVNGARTLRTIKPSKQQPIHSSRKEIVESAFPPYPFNIRPFICTCDHRLDTFERFVESYETVAWCMKKPIVFAGYDKGNQKYISLLERLKPEIIIEQPEDNFQLLMIRNLPQIASKYNEPTLFLEDDILFSSWFPHALAKVITFETNLPKDIVTFYGNGNCYWPKTNDFIYKFSGNDYYGNLCVLFGQELINWWATNWEEVWNHPVGGWDIKIGQYFELKGYNWFCTKSHFVQHQIGLSAISGNHKEQQSNLFVV